MWLPPFYMDAYAANHIEKAREQRGRAYLTIGAAGRLATLGVGAGGLIARVSGSSKVIIEPMRAAEVV